MEGFGAENNRERTAGVCGRAVLAQGLLPARWPVHGLDFTGP